MALGESGNGCGGAGTAGCAITLAVTGGLHPSGGQKWSSFQLIGQRLNWPLKVS